MADKQPYFALINCPVEYGEDEGCNKTSDQCKCERHEIVKVLVEFEDEDHWVEVEGMSYDWILEDMNKAMEDLPGGPYITDQVETNNCGYDQSRLVPGADCFVAVYRS